MTRTASLSWENRVEATLHRRVSAHLSFELQRTVLRSVPGGLRRAARGIAGEHLPAPHVARGPGRPARRLAAAPGPARLVHRLAAGQRDQHPAQPGAYTLPPYFVLDANLATEGFQILRHSEQQVSLGLSGKNLLGATRSRTPASPASTTRWPPARCCSTSTCRCDPRRAAGPGSAGRQREGEGRARARGAGGPDRAAVAADRPPGAGQPQPQPGVFGRRGAAGRRAGTGARTAAGSNPTPLSATNDTEPARPPAGRPAGSGPALAAPVNFQAFDSRLSSSTCTGVGPPGAGRRPGHLAPRPAAAGSSGRQLGQHLAGQRRSARPAWGCSGATDRRASTTMPSTSFPVWRADSRTSPR